MEPGQVEFRSIQRHRAYEGIVAQIEDALRTGRLGPGDRLPSEREMMEQFSVSRPTVREALRVLESNGVVTSRPGDPKGPVVADFAPRGLQKSIARMINLDAVSRLELLQFRLTLEGTACRLAAQHRTDAELAEIGASSTALLKIADGGAGSFGDAVLAFHSAIRRAGRNQLLQACGDAVHQVMREVIDSRIQNEPARRRLLRRSAERSAEVLEAIADQDGARAAEAVRLGILEYYDKDLTADERRNLTTFLTAP